MYEHEITSMEAKSLTSKYQTKLAARVKQQMVKDWSKEDLAKQQKKHMATRKINYGQRVKELYMPEVSPRKVRQSEMMVRDEYNPYIKSRRKFSHGDIRGLPNPAVDQSRSSDNSYAILPRKVLQKKEAGTNTAHNSVLRGDGRDGAMNDIRSRSQTSDYEIRSTRGAMNFV